MPKPAHHERVSSDAELDDLADRLILASWASSYNTQSTSSLNRFIKTCTAHNWTVLPLTERTLTRYAAYRYTTTNNIGSSFRTELYGIRQGLLRFGIRIDIRVNGPMIRLNRLVHSWCKVRGTTQNRKAVTSDILKAFFEHLDPNKHDEQVMRAMLAVAKFGMMRVSEYTYGKGGNSPKVGDLRLYPDAKDTRYMVLYFSKSKCNQMARTERVICMCQCPEPCPVHETARMLNSRRTVAHSDDLFQLASGRRPCRRVINKMIKILCKKCGLRPAEYSSHSLRRGGVTDMLCLGVPDTVIQTLSRHASLDSLKPYKKLSDENLGTILSFHMTRSRGHHKRTA